MFFCPRLLLLTCTSLLLLPRTDSSIIKTILVKSLDLLIKPGGLKRGRNPSHFTEYVVTTSSFPSRVDLRQYCSPVEDQANTNSCAANAVAGAFEYLAAREGADHAGDISRLFVYYVARAQYLRETGREPDAPGAIQDTGAVIGLAIDALMDAGSCLQATWPFVVSLINTKPSEEAYEEATHYRIVSAKRIPVTMEAMKGTLAEGYPFVFGLKLAKQFFNPGKSGTIQMPGPRNPLQRQGGQHALHAMLCVGYSDKRQAFIIRNSWSSRWGDQGYGYVPYDYMANPKYRIGDAWSIDTLTETDFTPDELEDEEDWDDHGTEADDTDYDETEEEIDDGAPDELDEDDQWDWFDGNLGKLKDDITDYMKDKYNTMKGDVKAYTKGLKNKAVEGVKDYLFGEEHDAEL
eukprot:TRINITY_DN62999_c0_g1_i1.p1 TRINITY_DN62999_c0_g1~~TRINITY_DN62999_c0_g1_i1.p1  ORF type:complete len:405 (-),score=53.66 TRINITY_DN62999_c0_g1_i1:797-2011(-)